MQEYALELLMVIESRDRVEDYHNQVRLALLSHDPERYITTFLPPEVLKKAKGEALTEEDDLEDSVGEWVFENPLGPEEAMRVLERMLEDTDGEIQASEIQREWL